MNVELCRKALEKVGDPRILVNLVSRRVRQLNGGGSGYSRPLVEVDPAAGTADIALQEIVDDKITWEYVSDDSAEAAALLVPKRKRKAAAH